MVLDLLISEYHFRNKIGNLDEDETLVGCWFRCASKRVEPLGTGDFMMISGDFCPLPTGDSTNNSGYIRMNIYIYITSYCYILL